MLACMIVKTKVVARCDTHTPHTTTHTHTHTHTPSTVVGGLAPPPNLGGGGRCGYESVGGEHVCARACVRVYMVRACVCGVCVCVLCLSLSLSLARARSLSLPICSRSTWWHLSAKPLGIQRAATYRVTAAHNGCANRCAGV